MYHHQPLRIICNDGLAYIGSFDTDRSNPHRIFMLGHIHPIWRQCISDIFTYDGTKWCREMGEPTAYDEYLKSGGDCWPRVFFHILYSDDL